MTIDYTKDAADIAEEIKQHFHGIGAICNYEAYECALLAVNLQLQVCEKYIFIEGNKFLTIDNPTYTKLQEVKQILENKLKC